MIYVVFFINTATAVFLGFFFDIDGFTIGELYKQ